MVAAAAVYILLSQRETAEESREVVGRALERGQLITRIRVSAMALESAVEAHLRAPTAPQREEAARVMSGILGQLQEAQASYLEQLRHPHPDHLALWTRFSGVYRALATEVSEVAQYSDAGDPQRAREHLSDRLRPRLEELDLLAAQLAGENAASAQRVQAQVDALRRASLELGGGVLLVALAVASLLAGSLSLTLRRQERLIATQLAELDRRNRELDAFAGRVAHDLLSPLAPLRGYLTVARRAPEVKGAPQLSEQLDRALESTDRVAGLVEALLRFHRAGQRGESSSAALEVVVTAQLMEVDQVAAALGVRIDRQLGSGVQVECPAQLLQSVVQNLLSNAVKYTAGTAEAQVTVRVWREREFGQLAVEDNGPGMDAEVQARLGQPFYRAPQVRQTHEGFGLGLAITRRLVEAHGGRLEFSSQPGKGTLAQVSLPLARIAPEPVAAAQRLEARW